MTMNELPYADREALARLRLTRPHDNTVSVATRMRADMWRVLVPAELAHWFEHPQLTQLHRQMPLRQFLPAMARTHLGAAYARIPDLKSGNVFNCATLMQDVFAWVGIDLPPFSIDQSYIGIALEKPRPAALALFPNSFPIHDPDRSIGHVGIITEFGWLIHASSEHEMVVEEPLSSPSMMMDILPPDPHILVMLEENPRGLKTALDVVRWLQR